MSEQFRPAHVPPPGRILERELAARGWTQRDLAAVMGRPVQAVNEIVQGAKQITPETAIALAAALGQPADAWLQLEAAYRLHLAQQAAPSQVEAVVRRSRLYSVAPIAELIRRRWLPKTEDLDALEAAVCRFLAIPSLDVAPRLSVAFRHAETREPTLSAKIAWVRRVEQLGRQQAVAPFDRARLEHAIPELVALSADIERLSAVPALLRELGVRFVIVRHLPKTFIDGAVCDLGAPNPIVALTLRYDRVDAFWFTLMHELAHIVRGHAEPPVDEHITEQEASTAAQEQEANDLARAWLVEPQTLDLFIARTRPFFGRSAILRFAAQQQRHPGIVVGQLQHREAIPYTHHRGMLVKVSPYLREHIDGGQPDSEPERDEGG